MSASAGQRSYGRARLCVISGFCSYFAACRARERPITTAPPASSRSVAAPMEPSASAAGGGQSRFGGCLSRRRSVLARGRGSSGLRLCRRCSGLRSGSRGRFGLRRGARLRIGLGLRLHARLDFGFHLGLAGLHLRSAGRGYIRLRSRLHTRNIRLGCVRLWHIGLRGRGLLARQGELLLGGMQGDRRRAKLLLRFSLRGLRLLRCFARRRDSLGCFFMRSPGLLCFFTGKPSRLGSLLQVLRALVVFLRVGDQALQLSLLLGSSLLRILQVASGFLLSFARGF